MSVKKIYIEQRTPYSIDYRNVTFEMLLNVIKDSMYFIFVIHSGNFSDIRCSILYDINIYKTTRNSILRKKKRFT